MRWVVVLCAVAACGEHTCPEPNDAPEAIGTVRAIGSTELSGLAASRAVAGLLWTQGDDGATDLYSIDARTAAIHGTLHLADAGAIDWEDLAVAPCSTGSCIYVLDGGDNDLIRSTFSVLEVTEPTANPIGTRDVAWRRFEARYPDGPHNMEALFIDPRDGAAYGITKVDGGAATVYRIPRVAGSIETVAVVSTFLPPHGDTRVTAADFATDGCGVRLGIRTHDRLFELRGSEGTTIEELLRAEPTKMTVADEDQGEGFAYAADVSGYLTISEGVDPTLWHVALQ